MRLNIFQLIILFKFCDIRVATFEINIETDEYNITSQYLNVILTWKNPHSSEGNITKISNQTIQQFRSLTVTGIESSDQRFRHGTYYLQLLGIRVKTFQILSKSLDAVESEFIWNFGPQTLLLTLKKNGIGDDLNTYLKQSFKNLKEISINSIIHKWDSGFSFDENIFKGKENLTKLSISGLNISKLTPKTFNPLIRLTNLTIARCSLQNVNIFT